VYVYLDKAAHIKPFLNLGTDTSKDTLLDLLNVQSAKLLDDVLNVNTLAKHTVVDERFDGGVDTIFTKDFPILSVTSIKEGRANTLYSQTEAYLFERNKLMLDGVVGGGTGYEQSKITYVAGYVTYEQNAVGGAYAGQGETMPENLKMANLLLLAGLYNQRQSIGVKSYTIQGKTVTFRDELQGEEFERIINQHKKVFVKAI